MNNYYDLMECDLPISFSQIVKNPIAIIFYLFCMGILISWVIRTIYYFKLLRKGNSTIS